MGLGQRIKTLRKERKMTQEELGKVLGVSKVSISGYEKETRQPDNTSLVKLAEYFGVTTDYLLGNTVSPHGHAPEWANDQDKHDLKLFLEQNADGMTYEGDDLTDDERQQLRVAMETIFWKRHKHN